MIPGIHLPALLDVGDFAVKCGARGMAALLFGKKPRRNSCGSIHAAVQNANYFAAPIAFLQFPKECLLEQRFKRRADRILFVPGEDSDRNRALSRAWSSCEFIDAVSRNCRRVGRFERPLEVGESLR